MTSTNIRLGISGWTYPDWREIFYPEKLPIKKELGYASRVFNSIEVNGTFYSLQKPHTFEKWYNETPPDFSFAIKAPKYITHERRLKEVETPIANFLACGLLALKEKLGSILWQLPPNLSYEENRITQFLELLPHDTKQACKLAHKHSEWMSERTFLECDRKRPLLHAVEVRNHSFNNPEFIKLMKHYKVAIVIGDTAGRWPLIEEMTGPIIYIRLHGDETIYPKGYTKTALKTWAQKIKHFSSQAESVYAFCDNDHKTAAPANAKQLMKLLGIVWDPE